MGRPRGSKNKNTLARELMEVNDQDDAYVEHENAHNGFGRGEWMQ
jgi:hypothetical protein